MELNNLSFDELLEAIRSDGGYKSAQAKRSSENTAEPENVSDEPSKVSFAETKFEEITEPCAAALVEEPEAHTEFSAEQCVPEAETQQKGESENGGGESKTQFCEIVIEEPEEDFSFSFRHEENEEPVPVFNPPVAPSFFELDEQKISEEEKTDFYQPVTVQDSSETVPLEIVDSDEDEVTEETVAYTAPLRSEPITLEIVQDEEEESVKIYTPPMPASVEGFNIDTDIDSLFPDVTDSEDENIVYGAAEQKSVDKTIVIGSTAVLQSADVGLADKTADVSPMTDDKTKHINFNSVFERPGIVTTTAAFDKTSDLSALPHILPADEILREEKKFIRTGSIPKVDSQPRTPAVRHEEDEQMVLPGFFEKEEIIRVNENEVEEELKRTRSRKVSSFKIEGAEIEEPVIDEEISHELIQGAAEGRKRRFSLTKTRHRLVRQKVEFNRPADGKTVRDFVARKKLNAVISAAVTGTCALVLLITTAIPAVADKINLSSVSSNGAPVTYIISLLILCMAVAAALPTCFSGISCFFNGSGKPNAQTPVFAAAVAALIHNIVAICTYDGTEYPLFSLAAVFLLCCCSLGNILVHTRIMSNFAFLFKQGREGLHSVREIDNAIDANRVSQNVVMGQADIRCSGKLKFATRFMSYSLSSDSADDLCAKLVPIVTVVSVVIGIIAGFITKSFNGGIALFSGAMCMGAPVCAIIASNLPLLLENKRLRKDGAMITSYAAAFEYESTNAIALDASDLFPGENCNIHGMKAFNNLRVDDVVLTAASMLIAAGGPISSLFKNVIMEHNELLLEVEELKYEERLGLSGWIRGRRIFVGNRKLLENHNIEIPMSVDESKYVHGDRQIIYLADAGKIAAFFVVSYGRNERIAEYLRKIENNGINILVRTTDSNINEKFIASCFGLPLNSVKVVSNTAGEVLRSYSERTVPKEDAKIIHNGTAAALLHAVSSASRLCSAAGKISTLQTFCTAAGLLLTAIIMIFSGPLTLSPLSVCICQLVWLAVSAIVPLIGKE